MTAIGLLVFCVALTLSAAGQVARSAPTPGLPDAKTEAAAAWFREFVQKNGIPGAVIGVARPGREPWIMSLGEADIENHVFVHPETRFRVGSVSKLFTAAAAARLASQGKLDLDAEIQQYAPLFPKKEFPVTARQLAGHLAGIRHFGRDEYFNSTRQRGVAENVKRIENESLLQPPGSKYLYSSYGYSVLGLVIEGACKQEFLTCLKREVLAPLGMQRTLADFNDEIIPDRARPYSKRPDGSVSNGPYMDTSDRLAAGGFVSTVGDLLQFGKAHVGGGAVPAEVRALLFTSQRTTAGQATNVGMSWRLSKDSKGRVIYHHGGEAVGGRAFILLYPEEQIVVVFLSNLTFAPFNEKTAEAAADLLR